MLEMEEKEKELVIAEEKVIAQMAPMAPTAAPPTMPTEKQTEYDIGPFKRLFPQIT